eukprot:TRINITY_DN3234_c0_g2_i1.p1 TRINITY_DN3234_c0_g2~~TRINITY_DN3234_c0_g2_i1.p1  ORF type:complete len:352 (-),score=49.72 TRINITY_DN3234_c0_g2_i1:238-1293(-)
MKDNFKQALLSYEQMQIEQQGIINSNLPFVPNTDRSALDKNEVLLVNTYYNSHCFIGDKNFEDKVFEGTNKVKWCDSKKNVLVTLMIPNLEEINFVQREKNRKFMEKQKKKNSSLKSVIKQQKQEKTKIVKNNVQFFSPQPKAKINLQLKTSRISFHKNSDNNSSNTSNKSNKFISKHQNNLRNNQMQQPKLISFELSRNSSKKQKEQKQSEISLSKLNESAKSTAKKNESKGQIKTHQYNHSLDTNIQQKNSSSYGKLTIKKQFPQLNQRFEQRNKALFRLQFKPYFVKPTNSSIGQQSQNEPVALCGEGIKAQLHSHSKTRSQGLGRNKQQQQQRSQPKVITMPNSSYS